MKRNYIVKLYMKNKNNECLTSSKNIIKKVD